MAKSKPVEKSDAPKCPVTKAQFVAKAPVLMVDITGDGLAGKIIATPKEFSTGSFGWYAGDKVTLLIDGKPVKVQVGINMTVVGSKDAG